MADAAETTAARETRRLIWRTAAIVVLLFWALQISTLTIYRLLEIPEEGLAPLPRRALVTAIGVLLSFAIVAIHVRLLGRRFALRIGIAAVAALVGCAVHALANYLVFYVLFPPDMGIEGDFFASYFLAVVNWLWVYIALSAILLALSYSADLRERERRMAQLQAVAQSAQLRALRYQLNPHFLFNTLNSIASLIAQHRNDTAEAMVVNLSDFLRTGLSLDPNDDIPLGDEVALQSLYLGIEELRFPDRLKIEIDVPEGLRDALVPSLIIQPLVENAVKYAVAKSTVPVTVRIAARQEEGALLKLDVTNSGGDAPPAAAHGTGVGLANVAARLRTRFGERGAFHAGFVPGGGFAASLRMPLLRSA